MLDVSRNAVMKVEQVKKFIDCLEKMGYNTLELYAEDTYKIERETLFGYMRGRYSLAELQEIDGYVQARGVEDVLITMWGITERNAPSTRYCPRCTPFANTRRGILTRKRLSGAFSIPSGIPSTVLCSWI